MITQQQIDGLRNRMAQLRRAVQERRIEEREIWLLVQEVSCLLNQVAGTPYEAPVRNIMELMNSIWEQTRKQQQLRCTGRAKGAQVLSSQTLNPISLRPAQSVRFH